MAKDPAEFNTGATFSGAVTCTDLTATGTFTYGDAAADSFTVTGTFAQTYAGTSDGHTVTGSGALTAGKDLARFSTTGNISSTSNVVAIEQTTGAGTAGAYGLYINCTGTNVEALKVDAGTVQFDEAVTLGVDDTGADLKCFGATSGAYMLWDASADELVFATGASIDITADKVMIDFADGDASTIDPSTTAENGWININVAGTKKYIPYYDAS